MNKAYNEISLRQTSGRSPQLKRLSIELPLEMHKEIKEIALMYDKTMKQVIIDLLEGNRFCNRDHTPNKETREAIERANHEENLVRYDSFEDMIKDLNSD